jgi:hypothetical protein
MLGRENSCKEFWRDFRGKSWTCGVACTRRAGALEAANWYQGERNGL